MNSSIDTYFRCLFDINILLNELYRNSSLDVLEYFEKLLLHKLRFDKYFKIGAHTFTLYTKITNLFNQKNIRSYGHAYPYDGGALEKFVETGEPTLIDSDGYDISYMIYYEPRNILVGLKYNFK